ncbi:unnamed protein product [Ectocarpus sp. CCAP 1310/34]|nr:unnamed protein product [Ectocarpus sp. CCAP 1310/34]
MDRFLPSTGGPSNAAKKTCGEPTCTMRSLLIAAVHQCPCGWPMHAFCDRGIGEEGFGQQRECRDCQRRTTTGKIGTGTNPMEVDSSSDNEDMKSRTRQPAGGKESETARKGKRPQRTAGRTQVPRGWSAEAPQGTVQVESPKKSGLSRRSRGGLSGAWLLQSGTSVLRTYSKLMNPEKIAELEKVRNMELNKDALRASKPVHDEAEEKLRKWIKIARARFNVNWREWFDDPGPGLEDRGVDGEDQLQGDQRLATSLPETLQLHSRPIARRSWRRGQAEGGRGDREEAISRGSDVVRRRVHFQRGRDGTFLPLLPEWYIVTRGEAAADVNSKTVRGSKAMKAKDRCTVVPCCNTTGSLMVPLAVISTSKNTMIFRHVRKPPCPYFAQESAWLDAAICQRWFDEVFVAFVKGKTSKKVALLWDNCPGHKINSNDPQIFIMFLPPNVISVYQPMDMGILFVLKCQYRNEKMARLADLIEDWDTVRARKIQRGCQGFSDAGQATVLDVTEICSQKWRSFDVQTVIRCWLKAGILPTEHCNVPKGMDTRLDREDKGDVAIIDGLCDMVSKMSMPASITDY